MTRGDFWRLASVIRLEARILSGFFFFQARWYSRQQARQRELSPLRLRGSCGKCSTVPGHSRPQCLHVFTLLLYQNGTPGVPRCTRQRGSQSRSAAVQPEADTVPSAPQPGELCTRCGMAFDYEPVSRCRDCWRFFHAESDEMGGQDCIGMHECAARVAKDVDKLAAWTAAAEGRWTTGSH